MSASSTVAALVAVAVLAAVAVSASETADRGHSAAQDAMDRAVQETGAPGVLGQAEDGGGVWTGTAGTADRATDRPRLPRDRFRIGSLTKPFIATVLLQLESEGALDLDDPVEHLLPGVVRGNGNDGSRITLRQLLRHTSGIHDFTRDPAFRQTYFSQDFLRTRYAHHSPEELVRTAMNHPPDFAPGENWRYSNTNYVLAGMIVERTTGHTYAHEVERRLVGPLGLHGTSLPGSSPAIPGPNGRAYSTLFASGRAPVRDVTALDPSIADASGEMISSTGDLVRFFQRLMSGHVLPPAQLREMRTSVPAGDGDGSRYGLGLTERTLSCGTRVWGHDGTIHGSRSVAVTTSDGSHTAAFNINGDYAGDPLELVEAEYCG